MRYPFIRGSYRLAFSLFATVTAGCASAPPAATPPPRVAIEKKMAWLLQLEDRRILRIDAPAPPPPAAAPAKRGARAATPPSSPVTGPDLTLLVTDSEARVRRRAALAIGRIGLNAGVQPLVGTLSDSDPEVREM